MSRTASHFLLRYCNQLLSNRQSRYLSAFCCSSHCFHHSSRPDSLYHHPQFIAFDEYNNSSYIILFRFHCLSSRKFSSGRNSVDDILGLDVTDVQNEVVPTHQVNELYQIIMDNAYAPFNMEKALDTAEIPLSTELVVNILDRLRYEEKIAFRFFMWAGQKEHYHHEIRVYNDMIDILSCTKHKVKQFRIVCDMLDYMKRNHKNSVPVEILLDILRRYTDKYLTHVQKFTKKKRIRVKTQPEINAFNMLVDAFCKCCLVEHAETMFHKVKGKVKPDANTYNILFFGWCRMRNPTRGMRVLDEMIKEGFSPDNFTYNTAVDTFTHSGMIEEATEIFEFMKTRGSTFSAPTAKTYSIMILALVKNDRMDDCFDVVEDMVNSGCLPDVSTYKELIEGMCLAGKVKAAYHFLEEMGKRGYPTDIVTYNCFLKVLCGNKQRDEALELYRRIFEGGCDPSVQTFNMLIEMFFAMDDPDAAFEAWSEMDERKCYRDIDTYCVMIEGLFQCGKIEDACLLLEEVADKGMKLPFSRFDSFLAKLSEIGNLHAIHKLSDHMRRFYNPVMARRFALNEKRKSISLRGR